MANQTIPLAQQRLVISKLFLGLLRELMAHLPEWYEAAGAEAYMISACVFIGHMNGRTMSASDIAANSGLPRTTVLRKLEAMQDAGIIERRYRRYSLSAQMEGRVAHVAPIRKLIITASRELSETDKL